MATRLTRRTWLTASASIATSQILACSTRRDARHPSTPGVDQAKSPAETPRFEQLQGYCEGIPAVTDAERGQRRRLLAQLLSDAPDTYYVAESGVTLRYLLGLHWHASERPVLCAVAPDAVTTLVVPAFEYPTIMERMTPETRNGLRIFVWQEHENPAQVLVANLAHDNGSAMQVAADPTMRNFVRELLLEQLSVVSGTSLIERVRLQKLPEELARLRRANEATIVAIDAASRLFRRGMSQDDVSGLVRAAQEAAGLQNVWVLALAGENASYPHGTRNPAYVRDTQVLLIDTGGELHEYQSDISRTFGVGRVSPTILAAYRTVYRAQSVAMAALRPGVACEKIDSLARLELAKDGWGREYQRMGHRLGHGIGIQGHEAPYLRPQNTRVLAPHMTMSVEPGIYVPGRFGIRIEDIVAITPEGYEKFGAASHSELPIVASQSFDA